MRLSVILISILAVLLIVVSSSFYISQIKHHDENLKFSTLSRIKDIEKEFSTLKEQDIKMLSSTLEFISQCQEYKEVYLKKDRIDLFNFGRDAFQNLKTKYGITHFYFIEPDGTCLVRLHNKDVYGDEITRPTFWKARYTKVTSSGIELGKTAFALRVVKPYYNDGELIGYIELGEEIDHFLDILKGKKNSEFAIVADKNDISREKWKSVKNSKGLKDDWDDFGKYIILSQTMEENIMDMCFTEYEIEGLGNGEKIINHVKFDGKSYACGGFPIIDVSKKNAGVLLLLMDITAETDLSFKHRRSLMLLSLTIFFVLFVLIFFISRIISFQIKKLTYSVDQISKGNLDVQLGKNKIDEVQSLADSFSRILASMKIAMIRTGATKGELGLGEAIKAKKKAELAAEKKRKELERFVKLAEGRELKMIDLKKRIKELEKNKKGKKK